VFGLEVRWLFFKDATPFKHKPHLQNLKKKHVFYQKKHKLSVIQTHTHLNTDGPSVGHLNVPRALGFGLILGTFKKNNS
jgi:hypothetical protein